MDIAADQMPVPDIKRGDHAPLPTRIADEIVAAAQTGLPGIGTQVEALRELQRVVALHDGVEALRQDDVLELLARFVRLIAERGEPGAAKRGIREPGRARARREKKRCKKKKQRSCGCCDGKEALRRM